MDWEKERISFERDRPDVFNSGMFVGAKRERFRQVSQGDCAYRLRRDLLYSTTSELSSKIYVSNAYEFVLSGVSCSMISLHQTENYRCYKHAD